jgi:hypothetical protein
LVVISQITSPFSELLCVLVAGLELSQGPF